MNLFIKSSLRSLRHSPMTWGLLASFLTFIVFDILWCDQTTFRAMSNPALYVNTLLASALLTIPYALFPRRWVHAVIIGLVGIQMVCVLMYCRTYFRAIPLESYFMAGNLVDFLPSVADSFKWSYLNIFWPLIIFMSVRRRPTRRHGSLRSEQLCGFFMIILASLIASMAVNLWQGGFTNAYARMKNSCYHSTNTTPVYALYGDLIYESRARDAEIKPADKEAVDRWLDNHKALCTYLQADSAAPRRNLVVIICESLESWPIGKVVEGHELTPTLNALVADSSTLFAPNVVTQVGSGRSIDFQLLFNAGMLPMENDVYSMTYPQSRYYTLNRAMSEKHGARSIIMTCDKPITWNQAVIAESFGIDTLLDKSSWRNDELVGNPPKLNDGSFLRQVAERLGDDDLWPAGKPCFLQIVTYSGHSPFRLPKQLKEFEFSAEVPEKLADYMTMANYTDRALGEFVSALMQRPDFKETVVVITGDHEGLADRRAELRENPVGRNLVDEQQLTPLIILNLPSLIAGHYDSVIGQIDIYPTLLDIMGLDDFRWRGMGESLFRPGRTNAAIVTMTGVVEGDTSTVSADAMRHLRDARRVSDLIIRHNLLENLP